MTMILSCGCKETSERSGVDATYGDYDTFSDGSYGPCVFFAHMCQPCIDSMAKQGVPFFTTEDEASAWVEIRRRERETA